jgi:hypothetical protein
MQSEIKYYKINDFIRKNASGEIDFERSIQIVRELAAAASFRPDHNILVDLRETTLSFESMDNLLQIVMELAQLMPFFTHKIANMVPGDVDRVSIARNFEACMALKNYRYRFFTEFEDAMEWLSEIENQ